MRVLAEVAVDPKQVERLTEQVGQQRVAERDAAVAAWLARPLAQREAPPADVPSPQLAVVEMDGGRLQIRSGDGRGDGGEPAGEDGPGTAGSAAGASGQPPPVASPPADEPPPADGPGTAGSAAGASGQPPPVASPPADEPPAAAADSASEATRAAKSKHWREQKTGCLLTMSSTVRDVDPCPEIPAVFLDPLQSLKLAQQIGHCAAPPGTPFRAAEPDEAEGAGEEGDERAKRPGRPEVEKRRVVASRRDVSQFGPLLAATACALGLYAAGRRAFVADGLSENWSVYKRYFSRWTAVLDFVHALTYVYAAAMAGRTFAEGWPVYERWIRWVWAGQVGLVIKELTERQQEMGGPSRQDKDGSPRRVVREALTYLSNHQDKMRYDEYRKQGLPLMSSHVESTVKQINYRVKGTEKFWTEEGAEALLQLRADYLSDDRPMEEFWQRRQEAATGQRRYRRRLSA